MDINNGKVSKSAMEWFGAENGVKERTMRWLGRPRPSGQHALVVVVSLFKEQRTPVVCFKCRKFRHGAGDFKG